MLENNLEAKQSSVNKTRASETTELRHAETALEHHVRVLAESHKLAIKPEFGVFKMQK